MKNLKEYILESKQIKNVSDSVEKAVKNVASQIKSGDSFKTQDDNAELIVVELGKILPEDDNWTVLTLSEYYDINATKWKSKTDCDLHCGDIIVIDKDGNEYYFDLKVGEKHLGAISMGSLMNFNRDGYYILLNAMTKKVKMIAHGIVMQELTANKDLITTATSGKRSYPVKFGDEKYSSEDFIRGIDLEKM